MTARRVTAYLAQKTAAQADRKARELAHWTTWMNEGQRTEHLRPLLQAYQPLLQQKMRLWKPPAVPESAFRAELQTHFIKALQSYDPSRGAALNTHVENHLQKAQRYAGRHANLAYLPEGQAKHIGRIQRAEDELRESLGRPPTDSELADHVGLTPKKIQMIQRARAKDLPASLFETDPVARPNSFELQQLALAKDILPDLFPGKPELHELFHYTYGTNGYPQIQSTGALAKKLGKSPSQISRMKTQLGQGLRPYMGSSSGT